MINPLAVVALVIVSGAGAMVKLTLEVALSGVPELSVTLIVELSVEGEVGVPEISPLELIERPLGSPLGAVKVYGVTPP